MQKKKIIVVGPALSQSGYGVHTRTLLKALQENQDKFDVCVSNTNWGALGWIWDDGEFRKWIDSCILKHIKSVEANSANYDISLQVTIPNEWQKLAPINIGVTASVETTKVAPQWLEKANIMDRIITISNHSKNVFIQTKYDVGDEQTGQIVKTLTCETPIDIIHYPVKNVEPEKLGLELNCDFNFLSVALWCSRKNMHRTLQWFLKEFKDEDVGLVLKTNIQNLSRLDRKRTEITIKNILSESPDRKCKVYLLHGELTEGQMTSLYRNPKIKALVTTTHGEGFGLPIFEAAYNELPVIASGWSGHCDFLYAPKKDKKGKNKIKPYFYEVNYTMRPIPPEAVWDGVLQADSMWAYPEENSFRKGMRSVKNNYGNFKKQAKELKKHLDVNFSEDQINEKFVTSILGGDPGWRSWVEEKINSDYVFVSDFFSDQVGGGAEFSLESLIGESEGGVTKINTENLTESYISSLKEKKWVFGNYANLDFNLVSCLEENHVNYSVVEFDYKFCRYRNLDLHHVLENSDCDCHQNAHGQTISRFLSGANKVFFMSEEQKLMHLESLGSLDKSKCIVLSSVFSSDTLDKIKSLREKYSGKKRSVWVTTGTPNWVKGSKAAQDWCKEQNQDFVSLDGHSYDDTLDLLASAKGLCFLPAGADTCPRLVIEAKLLGCELHLNDSVQHMNEKWFDTDDLDSIDSYLRDVPNNFWKNLAND